MSEEIARQIGRYKVLGELGRGGFGCVYRAFDASVGRPVAIKVLTERGIDVLARFRNEAKVAGNLRHDNIVTVYEYGEHEGQPFLAMEYLEGEDLQHIMDSKKPLSLLEKCNIMSQAAEGLHCAHLNGVVHRDVKPANIMVRPDGRVKIMDFGIARLTQDRDATRLTQEGWMIGTLLYMAPEQFSGAEIDALCDIFAYGEIYYQLLTGRHPFEASDARALMYKISFEDPLPIRDLMPECPEALERVVLRILSKDRGLRYQTLKDVQLDTDLLRVDLQRQRAEELLGKAQGLLETDQFDAAQMLVLEALGLDPSNRTARNLRESLQKRMQRRALLPRVDALVNAGDDRLTKRDFSGAIKNFEAALRLDSENSAVRERLAHARSRMEHSRAAASLLAAAQKEFDKNNLTLASRDVSEALHHDPEDPTAAQLLARIQAEIERRQKERRIDEAMHRAEGLVLLRSFDEAISVLDNLGADAKSPRVDRLLTWLRTEKTAQERREKLQAEMAAVSDLLRARNLKGAADRLEGLRIDYPGDHEVEQLLGYARRELEAEARANAIAEVMARAGVLAEAKDFGPALALLEETLNHYPGEPALIRAHGGTMVAKAAWERQQAIGNALQEGGRLQAQQHFAEAIELVESTLRDYNSDPALVGFLEQLGQDWARKRRVDAVRKAADHAAHLIERKQPQEAQQYLLQALAQYPGEESLAVLLKRAEEERRVIERRHAIEPIVREASARAAAHDYGRALALIDQGLATWTGDETLLGLRTEIADAETEWRRRRDIQACLHGASALASDQKFAEALELIARTLTSYPGDSELAQLESEIRDERERYKRLEAVRGIASEVRLLLSRGKLDEAAEVLREGAEQYQGEAELEALTERIGETLRARERVRAIEKLIGESQELAARCNFDAAREVLERGLGVFPDAHDLTRQLDAVKLLAEEWERQQTIARNIAEADRIAADLRFDEAVQLLADSPSSPELLETRRRIERDRDEFKRREAVAKGAADAAVLLQNEKPEAAVKLLKQLSSRFPGEPVWEPLMGRARSVLAEREATEARRRAIEEAVAESDRLARQSRFEDALGLLAAALQRFEGDAALLALQDNLKFAWEDQKRSQAIARAASEAGSMIDALRLEDAIAYLQQRCEEYAGETVFPSLLAKAERDLAARQECERTLRECRAMVEEQRLEEAVRLLEAAVAKFPGNPELNSLAAQATRQWNSRRREEAINALCEEALVLAKAHDFDRALTLVERGLSNWHGDERLSKLQISLKRDHTNWQREQARLQMVQILQGLLRKGRFGEGRERAEAALKDFPGDRELLVLHSDCRMREILAKAETLGAKGKSVDALRMVEACAAEYGSAPEWTALRDRFQAEVAAQERAAAIRKRSSDARALAEKLDFERALELLDAGLRQWPGENSLEAARRAVADLQDAHQRRLAIEKAAAECAALADVGKLQEALARTSESLTRFPDEPSLLNLRKRIENEFQAEERRKQRQRDLEELARLEDRIAETRASERLGELREIARNTAGQYPQDQEIRSAAARTSNHLADIEKARNAVLQRDFEAALQICRKYLSQYPRHIPFLDIQKDADRGSRALDLDEIRRSSGSEPDLAKRSSILEAALARYPDEAWVASDLRFTRNKLSMADSIVAVARAHEAAGAWEEALEQWNKLASIYDRFPGLSGEIERVRGAQERARTEALARWTGQIEQLIGIREYGKARELLRRALAELPGATPLRELERRLEALRQRQRRVRELLNAMRESRENGQGERLDRQTRDALDLTADDAVLRKSVLDQLVEFAGEVVETDWRQAEAWISLVRSADLAYTVPEELLGAIAAGNIAAAVENAHARVAELKAAGNLREALAYLTAAVREFPNEQQLYTARREIEQLLRHKRDAFARELHEIRVLCERAAQSSELQPLYARTASVAAQVRQDSELAAVAAETTRAIALRRKQLGRARLAGILAANRKPVLVAAAAAIAVAAGIVVVPLILQPLRDVSVTVTSDTADASVRAGSAQCVTPNCVLKLRPGTYTLTANKDGFKPISRPLTVSSRAPESKISLAFEALPEELHVNTNFESGTVYFDGRAAGPLRDSQFSIAEVGTGQHTIRVTGGDAEFRAAWKSSPGASPELLGPLSAKNLQAAVVTNVGSHGSIECNCEAGAILVDGSPAGRSSGVAVLTPLAQLHPGPRQIGIGGRTVVVDIRPNPALNVFLALDRNVGTLVISTGVDNTRVYLNDRLYPRTTEHGVVRIPVNVGQYSIRVELENYRAPARQTTGVAKGEEKQVQFILEPAPPVLEISGAQPQSHVKLDGRTVGDTDANGRFRTEVSPGRHSIVLSKDGYGSLQFEAVFAPAREPIRPSAAQLAMTKLPVPVQPVPERKQVDTEPQDWARVANSGRIQDLQDYLRKNPGGAHARDAQTQIDQLQQAEAARAEQATWDAVDKSSKPALQEFLARHGNNPHAQEARGLLDGIQRREAADAGAAEQKKADQARAAQMAADAQGVERAVTEFEAAFNRLDLPAMEKIYDPLPSTLRNSIRDYRSVSYQIKPSGPIVVTGDSASVVCIRNLTVTTRQAGRLPAASDRVRVKLVRSGSHWIIREIAPI